MLAVALLQAVGNTRDIFPFCQFSSCNMASCKDKKKHNIAKHGNGFGQ